MKITALRLGIATAILAAAGLHLHGRQHEEGQQTCPILSSTILENGDTFYTVECPKGIKLNLK